MLGALEFASQGDARGAHTNSNSILARSHAVLNELLLEAKRQYMTDQANTISDLSLRF